MTLITKKPRQVDLFKGWPHPSLLPPGYLKQAASEILSNTEVSGPVLTYGPDEGYMPLRQEIAKWLTAFYRPKDSITHERICVSGGASQNLACILQTFTDPLYTRNIWMVAPTYYLACRIFADSGFDGRLRAVPEDEEGIDLEYLDDAIEESEKRAMADGNNKPKLKAPKPWRRIYKHIIYAVPTFANPSGRIMSLRRREGLVRLARKYDALIITDDVYDMLQWPASKQAQPAQLERAILPRITDVDRYLDGGPTNDGWGNSVSNGSFSKIIGPGCRTGWAEGSEKLAYGISQTGSTRSGGAPSQLVASFIYVMLASGTLRQHIYHELQPAYARRYYLLVEAVKKQLLPLGLTMLQSKQEIAGGYFVWLTLPEPLLAQAVWKRAMQEENLLLNTGPKCRVEGDEGNEATKFDRDLRLCYAWEDEDLLEEGVTRLAQVVQKELSQAQ